jgi:hypothetical protein
MELTFNVEFTQIYININDAVRIKVGSMSELNKMIATLEAIRKEIIDNNYKYED